MSTNRNWEQCDSKIFWGDIATDEHVVQIYDDDAMLLNILVNYAIDGLYTGDSVIIIATKSHIEALNDRLEAEGLNLGPLISADQYIPLDADETLSKFMVNGTPDEKRFMETVGPIMKRAQKNGRKVRAFGEMVALLLERGNITGTIQLEHLWNKFYEAERFWLFCAYPKTNFCNDASASVMHICEARTKQIGVNEMFPLKYNTGR